MRPRDRCRGPVDESGLEDLPIQLYFGPSTMRVRGLFDDIVRKYRTSPAGSRRRPARRTLDTPSTSPLLLNEKVQDVLWEGRELIARSGLPAEPLPGQLTREGLIFTHSVASIFGFISQRFEERQRRQIAAFGSQTAYEEAFPHENDRILNQGFTLRELTVALTPECTVGPPWRRLIVSLGIDMGNDLGIIVPVTQWDRERDIVYRCYRLGETAHLAGRPLARAARANSWDELARAARQGFPIVARTAKLSAWSPRAAAVSGRAMADLGQTVSLAVPGRVVSRYEGTVVTVDDDEFEVDLLSLPSGDQRIAYMRKDQVRAEELDRLRPGAAFTWMVFEGDGSTGRDRTSRVRFSPDVPLDLEEMYRGAKELKALLQRDEDST